MDVCSSEDHAAFAQVLKELALSFDVGAIAEELNQQALEEVGSQVSVPQLVAAELQLPHLFCEPNRAERASMGIRAENEIRLSRFPDTLDEPTIKRLVAESWRLREDEWLRRLRELTADRVLFVCGADHIATFVPLARNGGVLVNVAHEDWQA